MSTYERNRILLIAGIIGSVLMVTGTDLTVFSLMC